MPDRTEHDMNRKIQETDRLFIVNRYRRDPYAFNARGEALKYDVSLRTIYNTLAAAGIQMKRGRKPLQAPQPAISSKAGSEAPNPPKPPIESVRKGPPAIRPSGGGFGEMSDKNAK